MINHLNIVSRHRNSIVIALTVLLTGISLTRLPKTIALDNNTDLEVTQEVTTINQGEVGPNQNITYTINYKNNGPSEALSPYITGTIPQGTCYKQDSVDALQTNSTIPLVNFTFSNDNAQSFTYTPVADSRGVDCNVTHIRYTFQTGIPTPASFMNLYYSSDYYDVKHTYNNVSLYQLDATYEYKLGLYNKNNFDITSKNNFVYNNYQQFFSKPLLFDYDHDGYLDIIQAQYVSQWNQYVGVYKALYNPLAPRDFSVINISQDSVYGWSIPKPVTGDFNNDGTKDLIMFDGASKCFLSSGGIYNASSCLTGGGNVKNIVGRFDNDIYPDIIEDNQIVYGSSSGTFSTSYNFPGVGSTSLIDVAVADFNKDTFDDVLFSINTGEKRLYFSNGNRTFTQQTGPLAFSTTTQSSKILLGDLNEDGYTDVFLPNNEGNGQAEIWINNKAGGFTLGTPLPAGYYAYADLLDFDEDGHLDIIVGDYPSLYALWGNGTGDYTERSVFKDSFGDTPRYYLKGDFNNDGINDLVYQNTWWGLVIFGDSPRHLSTTVAGVDVFNDNPALAVGDIDKDGNDDLVAVGANQFSGSLRIGWGEQLGYVSSGEYRKIMTPLQTITSWGALTFSAEIAESTSIEYTLYDPTCTTPINGHTNVTITNGLNSFPMNDITELSSVCLGFTLHSSSKTSTPSVRNIKITYNTATRPWVRYTVTANSQQLPTQITNSVTITSNTTDTNTSNNTVTGTVTVPQVDLYSQVTPVTKYAQAGEEVELDFTYGNNSQSGTKGFQLNFALPSEVESISQIIASKTSKGLDFSCMESNKTIVCGKTTEKVAGIDMDTWYTVGPSGYYDPYIRKINATDGSTISQTAMTASWSSDQISGANGMRKNPVDGKVYAMLKTWNEPRNTPPTLATLDLETGYATKICVTTQRFADFTIDTAGNFYASTGPGGGGGTTTDTLFSFNKETCEATSIMALPARDSGSTLEFNPDDGYLYHMSGYDRYLDKIDIQTHTILSSTVSLPNPGHDPATALTYIGNNQFVFDSWGAVFSMDTNANATYLFDEDETSKGFVFGFKEVVKTTGELLSEESGTIKIIAQLNGTIPENTDLSFISTISSLISDPTPTNNSSTGTITVKPYSEIYFESATISQTNGTYSIAVSPKNKGFADSTETAILFTFPAGFSGYQIGGINITCSNPQENQYLCDLGTFSSQQAKSITVTFNGSNAVYGVHTFTAHLSNTSPEKYLINNDKTLQISKSIVIPPIIPVTKPTTTPILEDTITILPRTFILDNDESFNKEGSTTTELNKSDIIVANKKDYTVSYTLTAVLTNQIVITDNMGKTFTISDSPSALDIDKDGVSDIKLTVLETSGTRVNIKFEAILGTTIIPVTPSPLPQSKSETKNNTMYIFLTLLFIIIIVAIALSLKLKRPLHRANTL